MTQAWIDTIFNWLNFAARIAVVVYIIKKYIAPKISSSIFYQKESLKLSLEQYQDIQNQTHEIEKQIENQEQIYFDLQNKFGIWQQALLKEQQRLDQVNKEYEKRLTYQFQKRQQSLYGQMIIKEELPMLLEKIQQDLQEKIEKDPELGKKYLDDLLKNITG